MIKTFSKVLGLLFAALFLLSGCGNETTVTTVKEETKVAAKPTVPVLKEKAKPAAAKTNVVRAVDGVFLDAAKISPRGKQMLLVFESPTCKYCEQMRADIASNEVLKNRLMTEISSYSLGVQAKTMHAIEHNGEFMNAPADMLADIYGVQGTPTLIFTDKQGQAVIVVPGYMPPEQFLVTLDFMKEEKWKGLGRKDGQVYEALKSYYIEKGVLKG